MTNKEDELNCDKVNMPTHLSALQIELYLIYQEFTKFFATFMRFTNIILFHDGFHLYYAEIDFKVATKFDFIQMHGEKAQFGDLK